MRKVEFLAEGEVCIAIFQHNPVLQMENSDSSGLSAEELLISASAVSHRGRQATNTDRPRKIVINTDRIRG